MPISDHDPLESSRTVEKTTRGVITGGSISSAIAGIAAGVLAILALVGTYPFLLTCIATIVVGVAFLIEGGAIASQVTKLVMGSASRRESEVIGSGMAIESLAGIAGIVLGILALIGMAPITLLSISIIVFGCGVLLESGAISRLNTLILGNYMYEDRSQYFAHEAVNATTGIDLLAGFAGIVLGILALIGFVPLTLVQVALLSFGCVQLLSGTALTTKVLSVFTR